MGFFERAGFYRHALLFSGLNVCLEARKNTQFLETRGSSVMLHGDKEKLEQYIRAEIEALKRNIISYKEGAKPVALDSAIGRVTRMDAINSKSISEESLRKAEIALLKLERALDKIDDPDFGLCMECGEKIPFKRLMIMPGSVLCVECAGKRS
jgi:DnaK suppressor protein